MLGNGPVALPRSGPYGVVRGPWLARGRDELRESVEHLLRLVVTSERFVQKLEIPALRGFGDAIRERSVGTEAQAECFQRVSPDIAVERRCCEALTERGELFFVTGDRHVDSLESP